MRIAKAVRVGGPSRFADGRKLRNLMTTENAKTSKGVAFGYLTAILYLAPSDVSGLVNVCPFASRGCRMGCLNIAGRGSFKKIQRQRIAKTELFVRDREYFMASLAYSVKVAQRKADREGLKLCVRLNGTSDLRMLVERIAPQFPNVQFYDYTKDPQAWYKPRPDNWHFTFSASEVNQGAQADALRHGVNVAMVFDTKKGKPLPKIYNGVRVMDGDKSDLRFLEGYQGVIVGLRAKGRAKKDQSGFAVKSELVQIGVAA